MEKVYFSIKMAEGTMENGNKIRCKVMVNYSINRISLHIKDIGSMICFKAKAGFIIKIQFHSNSLSITIILIRSTRIGNTIRVVNY